MALVESSDVKNATEEVLKDCMCNICSCYLSVGPIRMIGNKIACGRCHGDGIRLHPYEATAKQLKFPCRYNSHGCPTYLEWGKVYKHEKSCDFQMITCATNNCPWLGAKSTLRQHFEIQHPDLIIDNKKTIDVGIVDNKDMFFLYVKNNFICKVKMIIDGDNFKHNVMFFTSKCKLDKIVYEISFSDKTKTLIYERQKVQSFSNRLVYLNADFDLNKIRSMFEGVSNLTVKIIVGPEREDITIDRQDFQCPVCLKKMTGSITILSCGHSICMGCRNNLVACPICRKGINYSCGAIRNYALETIIQKL